jgi:CheY-like chemotaxis protein
MANSSKYMVLFVEDDRFWAFNYIDELQRSGHFEVHYVRSATEGIDAIERNPAIDAIILDVMMPTPDGVADTLTDDGHTTGIWLLENLQKVISAHRIQVWVLTNRAVDSVRRKIAEFTAIAQQVEVDRKLDVRSRLMPAYLKARIDRARLGR